MQPCLFDCCVMKILSLATFVNFYQTVILNSFLKSSLKLIRLLRLTIANAQCYLSVLVSFTKQNNAAIGSDKQI